jgi:outer membrane protein, multidrug efflux system
LLALSACSIPNARDAEPAPTLPAAFPPTPGVAAGPDSSAQLGVDEFFNDPVLSRLIHQALANNRELRIQAEEIEVARNEILARRGEYLPSARIGGTAGLEKPSRYTREGAVEDELDILPGRPFPEPLWDLAGLVNFDIPLDIWRRLRNARDAAEQRYLAAVERRNYTATVLIAEVAENYFRLMALDQRLLNLNRTIELQEQSLEIARAKLAAGRGTELAVQRFLGEVRRNQGERPVIQQEIVEAENRINVRVNRFPEPVERPSAGFFDLTMRPLSAGVPAQLLENRPDIRQAERELAAAGLDVLVARARFYPNVAITGGIGYRAFNPRYLLNPEALAYNVAGELTAPLINRAAIQADYLSANARQLQAVYNYQRVVLNAFTEVVNRLSAVANYGKSIELRRQQLQALETSVDVAGKLFQAARVEYIEVLFAQRDLLEGRTALIETRREQLAAIVNAYQALGGGGRLLPGPGTCPAPFLDAARGPQPAPVLLPLPQPLPAAPPKPAEVRPSDAILPPPDGVDVIPLTRLGPPPEGRP